MTYFPNVNDAITALRTAGKEVINTSGSIIVKATPVIITALGIAVLDISDEAQVSAIAGLTKSNIGDSENGEVVSAGIIEDITTSISIGESVYVGKALGSITNTKPTIGSGGFVSGDWVIRLGVIAKNINDALKKDMLVNIQIMGQL